MRDGFSHPQLCLRIKSDLMEVAGCARVGIILRSRGIIACQGNILTAAALCSLQAAPPLPVSVCQFNRLIIRLYTVPSALEI